MESLTDSSYCEHEWWEDTYYSNNIAGASHWKISVCRLCGKKRKIRLTPEEMTERGYVRTYEE